VNFEQYSVSKLRISCVDTTRQIVYLTGETAIEADHPTAHGFIPNHRYLVENVQDELTLPGQWFLDRSASPWTLTYLANPNEDPTPIPSSFLSLHRFSWRQVCNTSHFRD
jgi:hypothetical protein